MQQVILLLSQILDYLQFWLNLPAANGQEDGEADWQLEYSFVEHFGLPGPPTTSDIANLLEAVKTDQTVFEDYYFINTVSFEAATEENCDNVCRRYHYCAMSELDYQRFEICVQESNGAGDATSSIFLTLFLTVILLLSLS